MSTSDWHPKGLDAYARSNYDFQDAELLAQLWNIPVMEAKQAIGHKILNDIEDLLPAKVAPELKSDEPKVDWDGKALDAFFQSSFTFEDAERLAHLWGQPGAFEGKKLIGAKILSGQEKLIPALLKSESDSEDDKVLDAFFKSDYSYEDAALLGQLWTISVVEAKKTIGYKILGGWEDALPDKVRPAVG